MVDGKGTPLAARVSPANVPEVNQLLLTVMTCHLPEEGVVDRLPRTLYADQAYDSEGH